MLASPGQAQKDDKPALASPVVMYRINCGKCGYRIQVVASLLEWAKVVVAKHALARHGLPTKYEEVQDEPLEAKTKESPKAEILAEQPTEGC